MIQEVLERAEGLAFALMNHETIYLNISFFLV